MTPQTSFSARAPSHTGLLGWLTILTGLTSIVAVVVLALTGHSAAATAAGVIGGGVSTLGSSQVTINIRR